MWKSTYCMVPNIRRTSWKRQNHGDSEKIRVDRQSTECFQGSEAARCGILTVVTRHHAFVQAPGVHAARRSPPVSCTLSATGKFIDHSACLPWWGRWGRWRLCVSGGGGGNFLYLPFNFAVNLELLLTDEVYSKAEPTKAKKRKSMFVMLDH